MTAELAIAGLCCFILAVGHTAIGVRWVLPDLADRNLSGTPFGPPRLTLTMLRFTWHVVTLMLIGFGVLLTTLAWAPGVDPETLLLRCLAALWLVAGALAVWNARHRLSSILRLPAPLVMFLIAALCWAATT
jgi:hypothetical protein